MPEVGEEASSATIRLEVKAYSFVVVDRVSAFGSKIHCNIGSLIFVDLASPRATH